MNARVIAAINAMVGQDKEIQNVQRKDSEYYFSFKGYIWSMSRKDHDFADDFDNSSHSYYLHYYPKRKSVEGAMEAEYGEPIVTYWSGQFKGKEAFESFQELYTTLQGKEYGIDDVLNNIIDLPF